MALVGWDTGLYRTVLGGLLVIGLQRVWGRSVAGTSGTLAANLVREDQL